MAYGKSGSEHSFLFDRNVTLATCVNGQLLLLMLAEKIVQNDIQLVQANTDGLYVYCHKDKIGLLEECCKWWMDLTSLSLDFEYFDTLVQRDINNYLCRKRTPPEKIEEYGKWMYKYKGTFEIDKDLYKDHSQRIVPIAISKYFFEGIPVEETIKNHTDVFDFFIRSKANRDSYLETVTIDETEISTQKQPSMLRYYVSNKGAKLRKVYISGKKAGTSTLIKKDYLVYPCNEIESTNIKDYDLNYSYYILQANKEIESIEREEKQLSLF